MITENKEKENDSSFLQDNSVRDFKQNQGQVYFIPTASLLEESCISQKEYTPILKNIEETSFEGIKNRRNLFELNDDISDLQKRNNKDIGSDIPSERTVFSHQTSKDSSKRQQNQSSKLNAIQVPTVHSNNKLLQSIQSPNSQEYLSNNSGMIFNKANKNTVIQKKKSHQDISMKSIHKENEENDSKSKNTRSRISKKQSQQISSQHKGDNEAESYFTFDETDEENEEGDDYSEEKKLQIQKIEQMLEMESNFKNINQRNKTYHILDNINSDLPTNQQSQSLKPKELNEQIKQTLDNQNKVDNFNYQNNLIVQQGSNKQCRDLYILSRIKKFVFKLKQYHYFSSFNSLTQVQIKCIGDLSYDFSSFFLRKKQKQNQQNLSQFKFIFCVFNWIISFTHIFSYLPSFSVITPNTNFALLWNILQFITITTQNLCIPLRMSFGLNYLKGINFYILYIIPCIIMNLDLVLNFFTAFYDQGVLVTNKKKIRRNYLGMQFWIDFVTNLSFILISQNLSFFLVDWIFMIKICKSYIKMIILFLFQIQFYVYNITYYIKQFYIQNINIQIKVQIPEYLSKIDEHFQLEQRFNTVFQLTKLFLLDFFIAHYICCGFHYIGTIEIQNGETQTWLHSVNLSESANYYQRYINSIYFAFITMITVGYGDITPKTDNEKIFVIIVTIFSSGLFGFSMNTIGSIFQENSRRESNLRSLKFSISEYMRKRNISKNLQLLVVKNLEYKNQIEQFGDGNGQQILSTINEQLMNDVKEEYFLKVLYESKLFRLNFNKKFLKKLALYMKEKLISPGEIIYKQDVSDRNMYFLISGQIEFFFENKINKKSHIIGTIKLGFFCDAYTQSNVRVVKKATRLCYISFPDFQNAILEFPNDYESFCKVRDNLSVYQRLNDIQCYSCNNQGHYLSNCPKYFPIQFRQNQIISKHGLNQPNNRSTYLRFRSLKQNCLSNSSSNRLSFQKYRQFISSFITQNQNPQIQLNSQNDKEYIEQMVRFSFDNQNGQYIEQPSSEDERCNEEDEEEDEFEDDEEFEYEEQNKSELTKNDQSQTVEHEIRSCFKPIGEEESKLLTEKEKVIKNIKSQNILEEFHKSEQKSQNYSEEKKSESILQFESELEKIKNYLSAKIKRELEQSKELLYLIKSKTLKQSQQYENMEQKIRQSNLIYEDKNKLDEEEIINDLIQEKIFQNIYSQIYRKTISSLAKQSQSSSNKKLKRNISKGENQTLNDRSESLNKTFSMNSQNKKQSNSMTQKVNTDKSRGFTLEIQKLISQNNNSHHKNSFKSFHGKQATQDYINIFLNSINSNLEQGDKTPVSQPSADTVQYKGSHNHSLITPLKDSQQSRNSGEGQKIQDFNKIQIKSDYYSGNYLDKFGQIVSLNKSGNTQVEQNLGQNLRNQHKFQKDTRNQIKEMFYDESFTRVKEYEIYFPRNNQKIVMKKLRLYNLKTQIIMKKEMKITRKKRVKTKNSRSVSIKKRKTNKTQQTIQKA